MSTELGFAPVCAFVLCAAAAAQGNVLVIVADDLGVDQVGAYGVGSDVPATPNVDALAAGGVLFRNAWAEPLCTPSRAAMQTGLHPFRTGLGAHIDPGGPALDPAHLTIPEALDRIGTGWSHAYFGKWHLSNDTVGGTFGPNVAGWSHFAGTMANLGTKVTAYTSWNKVVDGLAFHQQGYVTTDTVDDALAWIQAAQGPWLVFVAFNAPHSPYHAPPAWLHTVDLSQAGSPATNPRPFYKAMVEAMDTEIGRLLDGVPGLARTTVIFLGDNGTPDDVIAPPLSPLHCKGTVFEGGVNVPFVVAGPHVAEPGRESAALVSVTDLFATIVDVARLPVAAQELTSPKPSRALPAAGDHESAPLAALPHPKALDSISFLRVLQSPLTKTVRRSSFAEMFVPNGPGKPLAHRRALRDARYKIVSNVGVLDPPLPTGLAFYDLWLDPGETVNKLALPMTVAEEVVFVGMVAEVSALLKAEE